MTQSGPIIELIEDWFDHDGPPMLPADPWLRAQVRRIMWIIAADTQPYQNVPFIIQAIGEWGDDQSTSDGASAPAALHPP